MCSVGGIFQLAYLKNAEFVMEGQTVGCFCNEIFVEGKYIYIHKNSLSWESLCFERITLTRQSCNVTFNTSIILICNDALL